MLRVVTSTEIFTILFVICLVLLTIAKISYSKRFKEFTILLINFRYVKVFSREQKFLDTFEALLFSNLIIGLGIFFYLSREAVSMDESISQFNIFKFAIIIGVFFLVKVLLERLLSSVLDIEGIVNDYIFQKISYRNFIGLLLLPINIFLVYSINLTQLGIILITFFLIIINIIGVYFFYKRNQIVIKKNIFYFILYLCALEISPYIILYKASVI